MIKNENFKILKSCKNKTEAYKAFNITPNSKGILKLNEIAIECGFDIEGFKIKKKIGICEVCGKEFTKEFSKQKFCSHSCSAKFNNKKRIKLLSDDEKRERKIKENRRRVESRKLKSKKCNICGDFNCDKTKVCNHPIKWYKTLGCFGFDLSKIGTYDIHKEYYKIKELLYKEYFDNLLSPYDIAKKYGYDKSSENILHILKSFGFETRNLSNSLVNACLNGKMDTKIKKITDYQFKHGWHTTWDNKKIYYRSSYELEYAKNLDNNKILYEVEYFRLKYWDSVVKKYRVAIPDFFIVNENKIIEIKSRITFTKQNMIDKFNEYIKIGLNPILILEGKEYSCDEIKQIEEFKFVLTN